MADEDMPYEDAAFEPITETDAYGAIATGPPHRDPCEAKAFAI